MLSPALALSLLACATAHTPGLGELLADLPPWGAALLAKVGAMEGEISAMKTTIATQNDMLKMQGETIADNSVRIQKLETRAPQASPGENVPADPDNDALDDFFSPRVQDDSRVDNEGNSTRSRKQSAPSCGPSHVTARTESVMNACCPGSGSGHRRLQASCSLPDTCGTIHCADNFISFYQDCTELVGGSPLYQGFYANCQELKAQSTQMLLQPVTVKMFKVHIATNVTAMPPPPPPASSSGGSSSALQEYHAVCSSALIKDCVPTCNATHHGYLLLAAIDGTDTKFSCNIAHGLYSWMGAASEGGYLGADSASFFSAVVSGAAGSYIVTLAGDVGIGIDLTIQPGQNVQINGDPSLGVAPSWGSGDFDVREGASLTMAFVRVTTVLHVTRGSVSLSRCTVEDPARLLLSGGGSLALVASVVSAVVVGTAQVELTGQGSTLHLMEVTMPEISSGALTGTMTVGVNGTKTITGPPRWGQPNPAVFIVNSGPCTVSEGGRCVGRPNGYGPGPEYGSGENCAITVGGGEGVLVGCGVFDTQSGADCVLLPDGTHLPPIVDYDGRSRAISIGCLGWDCPVGSGYACAVDGPMGLPGTSFAGSNCPVGAALRPGQTVSWHAGTSSQGFSDRRPCLAKGLCGLPYSASALGGGWQICFA